MKLTPNSHHRRAGKIKTRKKKKSKKILDYISAVLEQKAALEIVQYLQCIFTQGTCIQNFSLKRWTLSQAS